MGQIVGFLCGQKFVCTNPDVKVNDIVPDASHPPSAFYGLFVDDDVIQCMVDETNRNAEQVLESTDDIPLKSRLKSWHDTDASEMQQFIGLLM